MIKIGRRKFLGGVAAGLAALGLPLKAKADPRAFVLNSGFAMTFPVTEGISKETFFAFQDELFKRAINYKNLRMILPERQMVIYYFRDVRGYRAEVLLEDTTRWVWFGLDFEMIRSRELDRRYFYLVADNGTGALRGLCRGRGCSSPLDNVW